MDMEQELTEQQKEVAKRVRAYLGPSRAADAATDAELLAESDGKSYRAFIELGVAWRAFWLEVWRSFRR